MLHHRTLTPVILRDWSHKMELFTAALALTAKTSTKLPKPLKFLTPAEIAALRAREWVRSGPAQSSYLDRAVEPVSWPARTEPRTPADARPRLPHENRDYNRAHANPPGPARLTETAT